MDAEKQKILFKEGEVNATNRYSAFLYEIEGEEKWNTSLADEEYVSDDELKKAADLNEKIRKGNVVNIDIVSMCCHLCEYCYYNPCYFVDD